MGRSNVEAVRELALRSPRLVHVSHQLRVRRPPAPSPTPRTTCRRRARSTRSRSSPASTPRWRTAPRALVVRTAGLYGLHGSASKGGNFVQRMIARAREQGALRMVADQRLQPTFTADLAAAHRWPPSRPAPTGVVHLTAVGRVLAGTSSPSRSWSAPASTSRSSRSTTTIAPGRRGPPAERRAGPSACRRAGPAARCVRGDEALADYMRARRARCDVAASPDRNRLKGERRWKRLDDTPRRADPDRAASPRRRARLLLRDLPPRASSPSSGSPRRWSRTTTRAPRTGIVRGMHFQIGARRRQARPLRARRDLRRRRRHPRAARPPSAQWEGFELTEENMHMVYCPVGFAHGFCVPQRRRRRHVQAEQLLRRRDRARHRLQRSRRRRSSGRSPPRS